MLFALAMSALASPTLEIDGQCPYGSTITITGATPAATIEVYRGDGPGSKVIPGGACVGVTTGLSTSGFKVSSVVADAYGNAVMTPALRGASCEYWLQAVDTATCDISAAEPLARPDEEWVFANYAGFWDGDVQYNGSVTCGSVCALTGRVATGARFVCNLHNNGDTEGCTQSNEFAYGTANCGLMVKDGVVTTENGNMEDCAGGAIASCVSGSCTEGVTYHALQCQCI